MLRLPAENSAAAAPPADVSKPEVSQPATQQPLIAHAAAVLGTTAERLDPRRPLRDIGLDSLMATQLSRRLLRDLGVDVAAVRLLGPESAATIAADLKSHVSSGTSMHR